MYNKEMNPPEGGVTAPQGARRPRVLGLAVIVALFGLLLWGKLLLVTGYPRTAVADPDAGVLASQAQTCADVK